MKHIGNLVKPMTKWIIVRNCTADHHASSDFQLFYPQKIEFVIDVVIWKETKTNPPRVNEKKKRSAGYINTHTHTHTSTLASAVYFTVLRSIGKILYFSYIKILERTSLLVYFLLPFASRKKNLFKLMKITVIWMV